MQSALRHTDANGLRAAGRKELQLHELVSRRIARRSSVRGPADGTEVGSVQCRRMERRVHVPSIMNPEPSC